jgi:hypothetical protein
VELPISIAPGFCRKGEGLGFDVDKNAPEQAYASIKCRRYDVLEIDEKAPDPWREVPRKELPVGANGRRDFGADQTGHDLAQDCDMVFGL